MPLEFALRPRFDLERASPQRKLRKARLSPLALPMLAYWLLMAGATHLLLRSVAEQPAESGARAMGSPRVSEMDEAPPNPPARAFAPAPPMVAASEPKPDLERVLAPSVRAWEPAAPRATERPATVAFVAESAPAPPSRGAPASVARAPERAVAAAAERAIKREPERDEGRAGSLPSCESADASANQSIDLRAAPGAPDLSREAFASVLESGGYLTHCAIPARTALEICAAVQDGKVVGVSVASEPRNAAVSACVRRSVAALRFPQSARLDVTRTRFEAAR